MPLTYKTINSMYRKVVADYNKNIDPKNPPTVKQIRSDLLRICRDEIKKHNDECKAEKKSRTYYWPMIQSVPPIMIEDIDKAFHPERYITEEMKWNSYLEDPEPIYTPNNTEKEKKK